MLQFYGVSFAFRRNTACVGRTEGGDIPLQARVNQLLTMFVPHMTQYQTGILDMDVNQDSAPGLLTLAEIKEFASFSASAQRYIRRSLDVAFERIDAVALWSRDADEAASILAQKGVYERLDSIRALLPDSSAVEAAEEFFAPLVTVAAFDLGQGRLDSFATFRFLYERLIAAESRPWLPATFCAAASMPHLQPDRRKKLLQSISEAAATAPGWSKRAPSFFPEWVEKVQMGSAAH